MFGIVNDRHLHAEIFRQRVDKAVNRSRSLALDILGHAVIGDFGGQDTTALLFRIGHGVMIDELDAGIGLRHIKLLELLVNALRRQFLAFFIGNVLNDLAELDLQVARQVQAIIRLQDIGDTALARLRIDANDRFIGTAHILRVDRQIGHFPDRRIGRTARLHALVDRILMRAGESRIDQLADIRMALGNLQLVRIFIDFLHPVDVGAVQLRVHALRVHVECQRHHIDIAGAFAIAEQRTFNAVGTSHQAQFGCSNARATVIMRVQRDNQVLTIVEVAAHPFDLVGIDVRRVHLDGRRQVDDQLVVCGRLHDLDDRIADFQRHIQLSARKAFGRILEAITAPRFRSHIHDHLGSVGRDLLDTANILGEDHAALQFTGGIVEMDDRRLGAFKRFESARDQFWAALDQNLQIHFVGNIALFDGPAAEIEIRLRSGRKTDFDFRETHIDQQAEHALLAVMAHGVDQGLIAITQIDRTPDRCLFDTLGRPGAVIELRNRERRIFAACSRHAFALGNGFRLRRGDGLIHFRFLPAFDGIQARQARILLIDYKGFLERSTGLRPEIDRRTLLSASPAIAAKAEGKKRV